MHNKNNHSEQPKHKKNIFLLLLVPLQTAARYSTYLHTHVEGEALELVELEKYVPLG